MNNNYFEEKEYISNSSTETSDIKYQKPENNDQYINIDYNYYTTRKPTKKIIGYVKEQN